MMQKNMKQPSAHQNSKLEDKRTVEIILDEYKILSLHLFEQAGIISENDIESTSLSIKQAGLLDAQQSLLIEVQTMKLNNDKEIIALLQLWKSEEVYNDDITPSQGLVLRLLNHFERALV